MIDSIFNLDRFRIISDDKYYYFFRALNNRDHEDITNGITISNDKLSLIKTDREYYLGDSKYDKDSPLSLEQVYDHIKIHHRIDTNCISLTSNPNVALMYGREFYHDEYVIVKVPKDELGNKTIVAGFYFLQEIEKIVNRFIEEEKDELIKYYIDSINNARSQEQLDEIINRIKEKSNEDNSMLQKGIEYIKVNYNVKNYPSLSPRQNLEKNKLIAKISILKKQLLPNISNSLLIQTMAISFASLELIHYGNIEKEEIIECPKQIVDCFALLAQVDNNPLTKELEQFLLDFLNNPLIYKIKYEDSKLVDHNITLDVLYNTFDGSIDYTTIYNILSKSYYLSKSKIRSLQTIAYLNKITNNSKYQDLFRKMVDTCFGIEPSILKKSNLLNKTISETVGLDISYEEQELLDYILKLDKEDLEVIINKPLESLKVLVENLDIYRNKISKEEWFANAIIDLFDFKKLNIRSISITQRSDLVNKLIEYNCVDVYYKLKEIGIKEKDIANVLLTCIIKNKKIDINDIKLNETFTLDELENFLGYYKILNTEIVLRNYQYTTVKNIDECFINHKFSAAILPTGGGKSFVALSEMLKFKDRQIIYIAPNDIILNQIEDYIVEYIRGKKGTFGKYNSIKERKKIINEVFPNLILTTYQKINITKSLREKRYDLIILDEIHRSGAPEWIKSVKNLMDNQGNYVKILGITATPERDCDGIDMVDYWAKYLGYSKSDILRHKHLAINMDIYEAIKLGYVINPKVVSCVYDLISPNGELDNLFEQIKLVYNKEKNELLMEKYKKLRKQISHASGVNEILNEHLKKGRKYIVFCPVVNETGIPVEDCDGNIIDSRITGIKVIEKYESLLKEYLGEENIECYSLLAEYSKSKNRRNLELFEQGKEEKITFLIVMDKANEGMHIKNDGLIWFRPLDEESTILCSQQFGRIVYALTPGQEIKDEDLPIAIDLTNNLIRIKMGKKKTGSKVDDLDKLKYIIDWIEEHNKIPDINSDNKVESRYASILKSIQKKYKKYNNIETFEKLFEDEQELISEILLLGSKIDLWNLDIPKKIRREHKNNHERDIFELSGLLKDFYELKQEVEASLPRLSLEQKIEEVYQEYLKTGHIVKHNSVVRFTNGGLMASWLYQQKHNPKILDYALVNEHARIIVELAHLDKTHIEYMLSLTIKKVKYIYHNYVLKNIPIPKQEIKDTFPDGIVISGWIRRETNENYIRMLLTRYSEDYDIIMSVIEFAGLNNKKTKEEILIERLKFVCEEYLFNGKNIPSKTSKDEFEDGIRIYGYLKRCKESIISLAHKGNIHAKEIIEKTDFLLTKEELIKKSFEEKLDYVYKTYILNNIPIPNRESNDTFIDGTKVCNWLKGYKEKISEAASNGDIRAQEIFKQLTPEIVRLKSDEEVFKEELKYVYQRYCIQGYNFNEEKETVKFPSGKMIINWYYNNTIKIENLAKSGNKYAKFIVDNLMQKHENIFLQKIEYLYNEYILKGKKISRVSTEDKFPDGSVISFWLFTKNSKLKLRRLANEGNIYALALVKELGIKKLSVDKSFYVKLDYIIDTYINQGKKVPFLTSTEKFPDGTLIGEWLNSYRETLKDFRGQGNEKAKLLVEHQGWHISSAEKTIEIAKKRIHYIYEEYIKKGLGIPNSKSNDCFKDTHTNIYNWIKMPKTKEIITQLVAQNNEEAKALYDLAFIDKEVLNYEKVKYIFNTYIKEKKEIPNINSRDKFADGIYIGGWIKDNKEKIFYYANQGIIEAQVIIYILGFDKTPEERSKQRILDLLIERLNYLNDMYIKNGLPFPKYDDIDKFEDGVPIYKWLNRKDNKANIEELANEGNDIALEVMRRITWGKKALIRLSNINEKALEICLYERWVLEKDAINYPSYKKLIKK